jgi:hypothetical protein
MAVDVEVTGADRVESRLIRARVRSRALGPKLERRWAFRLKAEVRRSASRFKKTGVYDKSIVVRNGNEVLTTHPAGPRLEKGFIATDSAGRTYAQAPQPHWLPSRIKIAKAMAKDARREVISLGD